MRKFTFLFTFLFLTLGAMAQTFVQPEIGKYYKIKGDNSQYPWLMGVQKSGGSGVAVSANEADAAIFEKTANGLKVYGTNTYLYYSGSGDVTIGNTESGVTIGDYSNSTDAGTKYSIKVAGAYMYNNNTDQQVHTSGTFITNIERYWGFIEVNMGGNGDGEDDGKIVADGVYTIDNKYNGRGSMAYGMWKSGWFSKEKEYFGLTGITLNGCTNNNLTVDPVSNKYWYVKTTDKGVYIYNIGKGVFLQERASEKATCAADIANGFTLVERTANNTNYVSVKSGNYYLSYSCGWAPNSDYGSVRWLADDEAAATLMTFTPVANAATTYANEIAAANAKINAFEVDNEEAKAALAEAIAQAEAMLAVITIGDGVGEYSGGEYPTNAALESVLGRMRNYYNTIDANTPIAEIEAYIAMINEIMASYTLNMPTAGYYRIKAVAGWNDDAPYLTSVNTTVSGKTTRAAFVANADASTIFYFDGVQLLSYATGNFLVSNSGFLGYNGVQAAGIDVTFAPAANGLVGAYKISFANSGRCLFANQDNYTDAGNGTDNRNGYCFNLEAVTELPVSITSAGYATFFAPVAVTVPSGVTAHTVTINGEWATLSEPLSVIPANTGVVLVGEGSHDFAITTANAFEGDNALLGTAAAAYITEDAYVLGYINVAEEGQPEKKEVGFYTATKNQQDGASWKNNSHKAYLPMSNANGAVSYSFRFPGTTVIENVEVENTVKAIYDLTGRKVDEITAPGIYIVNGKKTLVK